MNKRLFFVLATLLLAFAGLVACNRDDDSVAATLPAPQTESYLATVTAAAEPTATPEPTATVEPIVVTTVIFGSCEDIIGVNVDFRCFQTVDGFYITAWDDVQRYNDALEIVSQTFDISSEMTELYDSQTNFTHYGYLLTPTMPQPVAEPEVVQSEWVLFPCPWGIECVLSDGKYYAIVEPEGQEYNDIITNVFMQMQDFPKEKNGFEVFFDPCVEFGVDHEHYCVLLQEEIFHETAVVAELVVPCFEGQEEPLCTVVNNQFIYLIIPEDLSQHELTTIFSLPLKGFEVGAEAIHLFHEEVLVGVELIEVQE